MKPIIAMAATLATIAALATATGPGDEFDMVWHTIDAGGGASTAGGFDLAGTIGQPDAGPAITGGDFSLVGGFWAAPGGPAPPCQGDANGDSVVNVVDLVAVILAWGTDDPAADINGDGVVNVADLVEVILAWGTCL